jgi:hypothetical protein
MAADGGCDANLSGNRRSLWISQSKFRDQVFAVIATKGLLDSDSGKARWLRITSPPGKTTQLVAGFKPPWQGRCSAASSQLKRVERLNGLDVQNRHTGIKARNGGNEKQGNRMPRTAMKASYNNPRKAEMTSALRGLICNQESASGARCAGAKKLSQPLENEVDTNQIRVEDCLMVPKKNCLILILKG